MGLAAYDLIENGTGWSIRHDDAFEGTYDTKEAALGSAVDAASLAIRQGHEVRVTVPSRNAGNRTAIGVETN